MPFSITIPVFHVIAAAIRRISSPLRLALSGTPPRAPLGHPLIMGVAAIGFSASLALSTPALADDTLGPADSAAAHDALVQQLVQQQHAVPLVADCAAHAAFVVPTSPIYDHVEFLPSAVDAQHASVEPWNQPFDDGKQRITVDTLVLVSGLGYRKDAAEGREPDLLKFRCGYVADKLLAFSYNEPYVYVKPHIEGGSRHSRHTTRGHHAASAGQRGTHTTHGRTTPSRHVAPHGSTAHKSTAKHHPAKAH